MATPVLLTHPSSLEHFPTPPTPHPERAERIAVLERGLAAQDWLGWERRDSPEATLEQLHAVHPAAHVEAIRRLCERGGGAIDVDTFASPGSYVAALHGAGGACAAVDLVLEGVAPAAFSAHRPPGHHATAARAMGFCLFSSAAVAARHAIDAHGLERVLVLDWDVHHGNGTHDILYAEDRALFVSIHESPLYPGTGAPGETGAGRGAGFTVNLPVPGGSGDATWVSMIEHVVLPLAAVWEPQLVLVSAGYDAHAEDPLAGCAVSDGGFDAMAALTRAIGAPVAVTLEGGYEVGALARCVAGTMAVLGASEAPAVPSVAEHPRAVAARDRLVSGAWPDLA